MTEENTSDERVKLRDVLSELTRPFVPEDIKWRVQNYNKNSGKALLVPYLDARHIEERLDEVVPGDWELTFDHKTLDGQAYVGGHVVYATMTICGVRRQDVGSSFIMRDQYAKPIEGGGYEKLNDNKLDPKTATSDSIKRVAAQFGIGRYLWNMDMPVFIDASDNNGQNKFRFSPPKHKDVDKKYHDYLYQLGQKAQITGDSNSLEVIKYLLRQVDSGSISASDLLDFLEEKGENALQSTITRIKKERSS